MELGFCRHKDTQSAQTETIRESETDEQTHGQTQRRSADEQTCASTHVLNMLLDFRVGSAAGIPAVRLVRHCLHWPRLIAGSEVSVRELHPLRLVSTWQDDENARTTASTMNLDLSASLSGLVTMCDLHPMLDMHTR